MGARSSSSTAQNSSSAASIDWDKVDKPELLLQRFASRRSVVYGTKGVVSASQPLAVEAGLEILRKGGNAGKLYSITSPLHNIDRISFLIIS